MFKKISFQELNRDIQIRLCVIPQCVSVTKNPDDETGEQTASRQRKFLDLPDYIKIKLITEKTGEKIQEIGKQYDLQLLQLADIARAIRSYYFGELKLEDMPAVLFKEMGVDLDTAKEISNIIIKKIINDDSVEKTYQTRLENISIIEATKKYPEIANQLITQSSIKTKTFNEPVRPSVKNWLSDYVSNLGYQSHSSMERGNYLFQSENTRNLSYGDRQKLSQILKSFDEKTPLTIDLSTKQLVFSESTLERKAETQKITNDRFQILPASEQISNQSPIFNDQIKNNQPIQQQSPQIPLSQFDEPHQNKTVNLNREFFDEGKNGSIQKAEPTSGKDNAQNISYQPKTQEPGNDFEKVIGLPEKEEKTSFSDAGTKIINLKEQESKKPPVIPPKPKNLLNIKDLIAQSQKEREEKPHPNSFSKKNNFSREQNYSIFNDRETLDAKTDEKPLKSSANSANFGNFSKNFTWKNSLSDSLDKTEKNLFQKNNALDEGNVKFSSSQKFPHEKEQEQIEKTPLTSEKPAAPQAQPYRIHPSSF